jgi:hypothetical protein
LVSDTSADWVLGADEVEELLERLPSAPPETVAVLERVPLAEPETLVLSVSVG